MQHHVPARTVWERLFRGSDLRISRFHDEKGNRVDGEGMLWAAPAFVSALLKTLGIRSQVPMISYRARGELERFLGAEARVVEFGSGFSTPWFARRCRWMISREDDAAWHGAVAKMLESRGLRNVELQLRTGADYPGLDQVPDGTIDLALIDGSDRPACIAAVLSKIRPGGAIYLDNSDKDMTTGGSLRRAEKALADAAREAQASIRYFTDFSPTNFFAEQGMLVVFPDTSTTRSMPPAEGHAPHGLRAS